MSKSRQADWARGYTFEAGYGAYPDKGRRPEPWCESEYAKGWREAQQAANRQWHQDLLDEARREELRKLAGMLEELGFTVPNPP